MSADILILQASWFCVVLAVIIVVEYSFDRICLSDLKDLNDINELEESKEVNKMSVNNVNSVLVPAVVNPRTFKVRKCSYRTYLNLYICMKQNNKFKEFFPYGEQKCSRISA